jgi:hypothetical protein
VKSEPTPAIFECSRPPGIGSPARGRPSDEEEDMAPVGVEVVGVRSGSGSETVGVRSRSKRVVGAEARWC